MVMVFRGKGGFSLHIAPDGFTNILPRTSIDAIEKELAFATNPS